ncbi:LytR/AlgR family response regulator transcription factor [Bizionia sediminis]|uniref:LytR/AlgR family response regulator transcription factor n=1 Tax=Bizionia sediminis TaxID=1737064 RepID=A0ABW5KVL1_9FLAO
MQKYDVLIVDDDATSIKILEYMLTTYCNAVGKIYTAKTVDDAIASCLKNHPDILLLDIVLGKNETSFSLLESIPNAKAEVIFITSYKEYAIQAINESQAVSYILKPVKLPIFIGAMDKAMKKLETKASYKNTENPTAYSIFLAIPSANRIEILKPEAIFYLEAQGRYTIFHLAEGRQKIACRNIGEYEKQLNPKQFFRIHHSFIVNLNMVTNINKSSGNYFELSNGKNLPIAKRRQEQLQKLLNIK